MSVKCNIYAKPYIVTLRRKGEEFDMVLWGDSEEEVRERVTNDLGDTIELISIRRR